MDTEIKNLKATLSNYGMTKLSTANDVTDANAYALSAIEKNGSINGTLKASIDSINTRLHSFKLYGVIDVPSYQIGAIVTMELPVSIYLLVHGQLGVWEDSDALIFINASTYKPHYRAIIHGDVFPEISMIGHGAGNNCEIKLTSRSDCGCAACIYQII